MDAKHGSGEKRYVCEECNSQYKTLNSMRAHKSRVHVKRKKISEGELNKAKVRRRQSDIKEQRLQQEILALELKTLPNIVSDSHLTVSDLRKYVIM